MIRNLAGWGIKREKGAPFRKVRGGPKTVKGLARSGVQVRHE